MFLLDAADTPTVLRAKLQAGRQSHAVCVANVRLALDQLSAAGLDLTVRTHTQTLFLHQECVSIIVSPSRTAMIRLLARSAMTGEAVLGGSDACDHTCG